LCTGFVVPGEGIRFLADSARKLCYAAPGAESMTVIDDEHDDP